MARIHVMINKNDNYLMVAKSLMTKLLVISVSGSCWLGGKQYCAQKLNV